MFLLFWLVLAGVLSWGLTGMLRRYALAKNLLDLPNARSSHAVPTPRGGGVAIVVSFLLGMLALWWLGGQADAPLMLHADASLTVALLGAGGLVALIGFLDDHGHIPAHWRLLAHFMAAAWALWWLGGLPPLALFGVSLDLGWLGQGLALLYLVWLLNLYNFMDGIDGIAGIEALTVCLGGALLFALAPAADVAWASPAWLLAAAAAGFLWWNFPRARIFMGDAGSGFVGIVLGILSLQAAIVAPELLWGWLILLGVFIVDATLTLFRRLMRGERVYQAHRSHAYQAAARRYGSHVKVSLAVGLINLGWLFPLAGLVAMGWLDGLAGVLIAYAPLVALGLYHGAGSLEQKAVTTE